MKDENIVWHPTHVSQKQRAEQKNQRPCILWFTGLSGSGKSTVANAVESKLFEAGSHSYLLDGDNVRHGINKDLTFTDEDRIENIRRIGEISKLFIDSGLIVLTAFISPFRADRAMVRELVGDAEFIEVFIDTPIEVCEQRDPKGLYKKARQGEIKHFTGIDSPYEAPENPEIVVKTAELNIEECADFVLDYLKQNNYI
ncbi:adenylyl-sulfate kinase [Catenovulum adriaticum]|uniref:Adenylyl-sulfate kinase n=1 Tax=Catenovulum adriaticum TaxID=2984846 RepID=A0ABY7ANF6_9ALTE|nr:adenylyl-sulfate kinase [Catenovulum sp. TS8]WAJ70671.1 adenylyl-sulfate kinase [Catenovulum sp. TS8]